MNKINVGKRTKEIISYREILDNLTSKEILSKTEFEKPDIITPVSYNNFKELLLRKDKIKNLELVPIKNDEIHEYYNSINKDILIHLLEEEFGNEQIILLKNQYEYWLPNDVMQYIIWMKDGIHELDVIFFIKRCLQYFRLDLNEVILFERPRNITSKLVKGTLTNYRHIHFWKKAS